MKVIPFVPKPKPKPRPSFARELMEGIIKNHARTGKPTIICIDDLLVIKPYKPL